MFFQETFKTLLLLQSLFTGDYNEGDAKYIWIDNNKYYKSYIFTTLNKEILKSWNIRLVLKGGDF